MSCIKSETEPGVSLRAKAGLLFVLVLGLLSLYAYFRLDGTVVSWLSQNPLSWRKAPLVKGVTLLGKTLTIVWLLLVWLIAMSRRRPILVAFLALLLAGMAVTPLKMLVRRPRPSEALESASESTGGRLGRHLSFPSGDTAAAFAAATVVIAFCRWPVAVLLILASTMVGLLRILGMAHYPSDVLAGAALGALCGWIALQLERTRLRGRIPRAWLSRPVAIAGVVLIPILIAVLKDTDDFLIFICFNGLLGLLILLSCRAQQKYKRLKVCARELPNMRNSQ